MAKRFELQAADEAIEPRSLYVHRPLKNGEKLLAWAKRQGFGSTLAPDDLHTTVAFSKTPIEWRPLSDGGGDLTQEAGTPGRSIQKLGDAVVLRFESPALYERWKEFRDQGASWDYDDFHPHISITYEGDDVDLDRVEPYDGVLEFGPEVFQEIKKNGTKAHRHVALDEAPFNEADHPRAPDGKFTSGGGGGGSSGSMNETEIFALSAKKPIAGSNYRKALVKAIGLTTNEATKKKLAANLVMSWAKTGANAFEKGDAKTGGKIMKKVADLAAQYKVDAGEAAAILHQAAKKAPAEAKPAPQKVEIKEPAKPSYAGTSLEQIAKAAEAAHKHLPPATPQEIEKAKKSVALQMSYVPGAKPEMAGGQPMKDAEKLIKDFNDKYAGKNLTDPAALAQKVNDFKLMQAGMAGLAQIEKKAAAEIAAKAKAEQAAKAAEAAKKAAEEAKAKAEKNKALMQELGIDENQAEGFIALAKMLGKSGHDLELEFKSYAAEAKGLGYPISGFECALIKNYSYGGYHAVNAALRSGAWTPAQHVYVGMVNKALAKMPTYSGGGLTRNTQLTIEQQKAYLEGHIIQEAALMSTSTGSVFSGNTQFKVTAIGKRGASIQKLSHYTSEKEVLFAAKTYFKVDKVEGTPGGKMVIHMTEWSDI